LPELVVTVGALRLGAVDLAVGNLFGSNLVNLGILGLMGLLYVKAPIMQVVNGKHLGTAMMAVLMTAIAGAELIYRPKKKALRWMSLGAFVLAFLYAAHIYIQVLAR
jgi:cation:H+ antiporter